MSEAAIETTTKTENPLKLQYRNCSCLKKMYFKVPKLNNSISRECKLLRLLGEYGSVEAKASRLPKAARRIIQCQKLFRNRVLLNDSKFNLISMLKIYQISIWTFICI